MTSRPASLHTAPRLTLPFAVLLAGLACGRIDREAEEVAFADASFTLSSPSDCVAAFDGAWLGRVADQQDWGTEDVAAFCDAVAEVVTTYAESTTLTLVSFAGAGSIDADALETSWFVGASGYDLTAIEAWMTQAASAEAVRACVREANSATRSGDTLEEGFARTCLEEASGAPFPSPIFSETRSSVGIDEVGSAAAGLALGLAIYEAPARGTVVAFIGGGFYAQADPAYGALLGCGAAIAFDETDGEGSALCLLGEY